MGGHYRLVWSDEFNGDELDLGKWNYRYLGPRKGGITVKDTVSLDGEGHLVLTTKRSGDEYHTAMIGTQGRYGTTYGYFEARVRLQEEIGHWSAFWLQSPTIGHPMGDPSKAGAEIDIYEYLRREGNIVHHGLHWDGYGEDDRGIGEEAEVILSEEWNTFSLLWTEASYTFYVNGEETWQTEKAVSSRDQYIVLSLEVGPWAGDIGEAELPDQLIVDYVRVYKEVKR